MRIRERTRTIGEIWGFLNKRKKFWLLPLMLMLAFVGLLVVLGQSSGLGPFVYPF